MTAHVAHSLIALVASYVVLAGFLCALILLVGRDPS